MKTGNLSGANASVPEAVAGLAANHTGTVRWTRIGRPASGSSAVVQAPAATMTRSAWMVPAVVVMVTPVLC